MMRYLTAMKADVLQLTIVECPQIPFSDTSLMLVAHPAQDRSNMRRNSHQRDSDEVAP